MSMMAIGLPTRAQITRIGDLGPKVLLSHLQIRHSLPKNEKLVLMALVEFHELGDLRV